MSTFTPIDPPDPDDDSFAAQLVRRHEPWLTADLDGFLRAVASMFDQVVTYSADTDTNEGWVILFDPDLCPAEALPYLGQLVGEVPPMPVGLPEAAAREWIKDNPNARRGTAQSVFQAAQRKLTGSRQVSMFERYQGVVDQLAIRTNTTQTPDPAGTRADILSTLPADVVLDYQVVPGTVWDDAKASSWTVTKAKDWDTLMSGLTGWDHYERPTP
jgi:hypothetical protein